ncbi:MAG: glycosyltransferase family 1 protein [Chthoniobacterales bacterium]
MLGFRALGHEVWYLEDTGAWPYDAERQTVTEDCSFSLRQIEKVMREFGFEKRWIYRNGADGSFHGSLSSAQAEELVRSADVLANVAGACGLTELTDKIPCKLFLDGDPMFTHIKLAVEESGIYRAAVRAHEKLYTFGLNVGQADCLVPTLGWDWKATIQPVALEFWDAEDWPAPRVDVSDAWTTVMNWFSYPPQKYEGALYGQKDLEFARFENLPGKTKEKLMLAMNAGIGNKRPTERLEGVGWHLLEPDEVIPDFWSYRDFIAGSLGEWSVAKHGYVASRSGWFSCRTACYLAAGRPAVVQDTGWSKYLPENAGVLGFDSVAEAVAKLEEVAGDWERFSRDAKSFAREVLDAKKVCADLLL